jgi:DNA-directed RNA polymerase sigma subunit (sigma70/sigma32)
LQQAAEDIGVTRQRAQQLEQETLKAFRRSSSMKKLRVFLYL